MDRYIQRIKSLFYAIAQWQQKNKKYITEKTNNNNGKVLKKVPIIKWYFNTKHHNHSFSL